MLAGSSIGAMAATFMSNNRAVVLGAGGALTVGLVYSLIVTQRSPHIEAPMKRRM